MIMSNAEYTMDVYVTDGATGTEISNIVVNKVKNDEGQSEAGKVDIGNTGTNSFNFTNTYVQEAGKDPDPSNPDPTYNDNGSLKVSKAVVNANGTTTTPDAEFEFTATFAFPTEQMQAHLAESKMLMEVILHLLRAEHTNSI